MPPDLFLAHLSDHLLLVVVLLYSVAMLGFAAEFSFGKNLRNSGQAALGLTAADTRTLDAVDLNAGTALLVGAGAPVPGGSRPSSAGWLPQEPEGPIGPVLGDGTVLDLGASAATARALRRADRASQGSAGAFGRAAVVLTLLGWAAHIGCVVTRGMAAHRVPWGNMYEFSLMISLVAVTAFLVLLVRYPVRYLGAFVMLPVVLYLGLAGTVLYTAAGPLVPALNSYWIKIHVVAAITSTGIYAVGGVATGLFLLRDRYDRKVAAGKDPGFSGVAARLPTALSLDTTSYRVIAFAFPVWTFAIIAGAIWAESAWGRYWGWDPKETWSFITWVAYACYLHARATGGWKGRRSAYIAVVAFACLTFDFYGVNIFIHGLHSYSGL